MEKRKHEKWVRILLAVIAINLTILSLRSVDIFSVAVAAPPIPTAQVCTMDTSTVLRVRFEEDIVPVRIQEIESFIFGKLPVEVKNVPLQVQAFE